MRHWRMIPATCNSSQMYNTYTSRNEMCFVSSYTLARTPTPVVILTQFHAWGITKSVAEYIAAYTIIDIV